jgi:uncharacterized protein YbcC (UPF0753/DUF2309 family)
MNNRFQKKTEETSGKSIFKGDEFKKYKKRILSLTKKVIKNKIGNDDLKKCYEQFVCAAIYHIKFEDKKKAVQKEYDELDMSAKSVRTIPNTLLSKVEESNTLIYKEYDLKSVTLDNFVKRTGVKNVKIENFPKQLNYEDISGGNI